MNFRFQDPWLWLLVIPAAAALWWAYWRPGRRSGALPFPDASRTQALRPDGWTSFLRQLPSILVAVGALGLIAALARPQKIRFLAPEAQEGTDIMIVLDTSGSMHALDFNPKDRITAAKDVARDFISHRVSDRIGIVAFAGTAQLQCPLTTDYAALLDYLDLVQVGMLKSENTAIGDAIATAVNHLRAAPGKSKVIILLTDGRNNSGEIDPMTAAKAAATFGIKIYTIGMGANGPAMFPVDDPVFGRRLVQLPEDLDEQALRDIADTTGGEYFRATNLSQLYDIYHKIDAMEKTDTHVPPRVEKHDLYAWPLLPALAGLGLEAVLTRTLLLTLP